MNNEEKIPMNSAYCEICDDMKKFTWNPVDKCFSCNDCDWFFYMKKDSKTLVDVQVDKEGWLEVAKSILNPSYYEGCDGLQAAEVIRQFDLNFFLGNVIKYTLRAGKKDNKIQDLEKAKWYLEEQIKNLKK